MLNSWSMQLERELLQSPPEASTVPVRLISADGETFVVEKQSAAVSNLISYLLCHQPEAKEYFLPNVSGRVLSLVLEFCTTHTAKRSWGGAAGTAANPAFIEIEKPMTRGTDLSRYVDRWDLQFIRNLEKDANLMRLVFYAANYLDIKPLFELICASVACAFVTKAHEPHDVAKIFEEQGLGGNSENSVDQDSPSETQQEERKIVNDSAKNEKSKLELDCFHANLFSTTEREWWSHENMWLVEEEPGELEDVMHIDQLDSRMKMSYICGNLFREFDKDMSSTLNAAEFKEMLNEACRRANTEYEGGDFTLEEAEDVINVFDTDGDMLVDLSEFLSWIENLPETARMQYEDSKFGIERKLATLLTALEKIADETPDRVDVEDGKIQ